MLLHGDVPLVVLTREAKGACVFSQEAAAGGGRSGSSEGGCYVPSCGRGALLSTGERAEPRLTRRARTSVRPALPTAGAAGTPLASSRRL